MRDYIIDLQNIELTNIGYTVLDNLSCQIKKNTFTIILGLSGTGKSSLLKVMAGIIAPNSGKVIIKGEDINRVSEKKLLVLRKCMGFSFQDAALISNLTIKENLKLPFDVHFRKMSDGEKNTRIESILDKLGIIESINERPATLSIGERKMISFARAIITEPEILFLDDPLTFIDPVLSSKLIKQIKSYSDQPRTTVIMSSYSRNVVRDNASHLILIEDKTILFHKPVDEVFKGNKKSFPDILKYYI